MSMTNAKLLEIEKQLDSMTDEEIMGLAGDWDFWARDKQKLPKGNWKFWVIVTGRGFGKTRTGCEAIRKWVNVDGVKHINIYARTYQETAEVIVGGESGLLEICKWDFHNPVKYNMKKNKLSWRNGAAAYLFSAEDPDKSRGYQCEKFYCDEIGFWRYQQETWDALQWCARLGNNVQGILTTTPGNNKVIKSLLNILADDEKAKREKSVIFTTGNTFENSSNLETSFLRLLKQRYEGTSLARKELYGEMLEDNPNALWKTEIIEKNRISSKQYMELIKKGSILKVVVGVDPTMTSSETSDECGIVVASMDGQEPVEHYYVLGDCSAGMVTPQQWSSRVSRAYLDYAANEIIVETNQGGELVTSTLRACNYNMPIKSVHATHGKRLRAEPISALYEQGRVHHVGIFAELENQMTSWNPQTDKKSPDRVDALVYAISNMMNVHVNLFR